MDVAVKAPCDISGCPALATVGRLCAAHASTATRVPIGKNKPTVYCSRCGDEIRQNHFQKRDAKGSGFVHASYVCDEKGLSHEET
jgi:hypothetical protein